jgi:hypothetical protein
MRQAEWQLSLDRLPAPILFYYFASGTFIAHPKETEIEISQQQFCTLEACRRSMNFTLA